MPLERYYKRERWELICRITTPMFLGNANQKAEWRAAPFKALLRYWWRLTQHGQAGNNRLLKAEGELFGFAGDADSTKSLTQVILPVPAIAPNQDKMPKITEIQHPEVDRNAGKINPLLYLAGMGLLRPNGEARHTYFPVAKDFRVFMVFPKAKLQEIEKTLALIQAFGAVGGRCRNGWGSFQIVNPPVERQKATAYLAQYTVNWRDGFNKDYPNCLGKDNKGVLFWKTRNPQPSWQAAMGDLADIYIGVRARTVAGIPKLNPDGRDYPDERHLLGFPLTNHPARSGNGWGGSGRHASPLRFVVKRRPEGYVGFILHLPHKHSSNMAFPGALNDVAGQIQVWEKVHRKLDALMDRATYGDCL